MPKLAVTDWDSNADNNTDVGGVNIAEGMAPSSVNNAMRAIMAQIAAFINAAVKLLFTNDSTIQDAAGTARLLGYRTLPPTAARSAAYTVALSDVAMMVPISTGGVTVPTNATTAFALGDLIVILNTGSTSQAIAPASGVTLTLAGSNTTGARQLNPNGLATLLKVGTDAWLIYGLGIA